MYLNIFKIIFIAISILLALSIVIQRMFMNKLKNTGFPAFITALFFLYIIGALVMAVLLPNYILKLIMLAFALSPFIIGKFARYKAIGLFSFIQIVCALSSGVVIYIGSGI